MRKQGNPPAFPRPDVLKANSHLRGYEQEGMTLRDYFAAKAMQGMLASHSVIDGAGESDNLNFDVIAELALGYADAMLKARES